MKKLLILATLVALTGCASGESVGKASNGYTVTTITDSNGCQYLVLTDAGITPRMDRDGKQICTTPKESD